MVYVECQSSYELDEPINNIKPLLSSPDGTGGRLSPSGRQHRAGPMSVVMKYSAYRLHAESPRDDETGDECRTARRIEECRRQKIPSPRRPSSVALGEEHVVLHMQHRSG